MPTTAEPSAASLPPPGFGWPARRDGPGVAPGPGVCTGTREPAGRQRARRGGLRPERLRRVDAEVGQPAGLEARGVHAERGA